MAELTKQALKVENNTNFPNNNTGYITPALLREFNTDMIDSMVDEIGYKTDSGSWNSSISNINAFTASAAGLNTGSLLVTASATSNVITFTKGNGSTFNVTVADTTDLSSLNAFTASAAVSITNLNQSSASQQISINALNANSASSNTSITNLNSATASLFTSASLSLTTASFNNGTRNLTFNKGDGTTFAVNIPDVSGSAGNFVTTSSFNSYTASTDSSISQLNASSASQQISINALNVFTASQSTASIVTSINNLNTFSASALVSISNLNTTTASLNTSVTNLNSATASLFTSASLGLTTASFNNGTRNLTFSKGDGTTFAVNIPDVSGSAGNFVTTSSFNAYTQSNDQRVSSLEANSASVNTSITNLNSATSSLFTSASLGLTTASVNLNVLTLRKGDGTTFNLTIDTGSGQSIPQGTVSSSAQITALGFVSSSVTASSLITASISGQLITFTKGDASTFNLTLPSSSTSLVTSSYGAFSDTTTQSGSANVAYPFKFNTQDIIDGVTLSGSTGLQVNNAGVYNIQFSAQVVQGSGVGITNIWFRKNNVDIPNSDTSITVGSNSRLVAAWNIFSTASAGDNFEIIWKSDSANTTFAFISGSGVSPNIPSIIATVNRVDIGGNAPVPAGTISGSAQITALGFVSSSVTASSLVTASFSGNTLTFTKGDASTFGIVIPDVSGSGTAFANPSVESISGSLLITANTFTSGAANLLHLTASAQNQANLVFKNNNNTGTTIVSGSNNIYSNPGAPAAGRINYVGGSNNLFLNAMPTITGSAVSVSGNRPTMNNNILGGNPTWNINQAANPGTHTYSGNTIQAATINFNTTGNTGAVTFTNNIGLNPTITLNSPSRSIAEINAGASGSNALTIQTNFFAGSGLTYNGPVSSSTHTISGNSVAGTMTLNMQSQSRAVTVGGNIVNGTFTLTDNTLNAGGIGGNYAISNNNVNGTATITNQNSASLNIANNNLNGAVITSTLDASAVTTVAARNAILTGNTILGVTNNIYYSGSMGAVAGGRSAANNLIGGTLNSASLSGDGSGFNLASTTILGAGLNVYGTTTLVSTNIFQNYGSAFFGRWNAEDGNRAKTAETIFAVGTGTSGSTGITRKTGFLIDSGSNTFVEGTLNVSGSTAISGTFELTGSAYGNVVSMSVTSNTASMNLAAGNYFELTSSASPLRIELSNLKAGLTATLIVSASVSSSITFSSNVRQPSPGAYSGSAAASTDILSFVAFNSSKANLVATKNLI